MKYEAFKKMWIEIAEKFKAEHPDWDPSKGAVEETCSTEVLEFLDQIASASKEDLAKLLVFGVPTDPADLDAFKTVPTDGILGMEVKEPDPSKVVAIPGLKDRAEDFPPDARAVLNALYAKYGNEQNQEQKLAILAALDGEIHVYATPHFQSDEEAKRFSLAVAEHRHLTKVGILKPIIS